MRSQFFGVFPFWIQETTMGSPGCHCTSRQGTFQNPEVDGWGNLTKILVESYWGTPPKFNSSPLKSYRNPIGKDRLPTTIFQGLYTLNLGGVGWRSPSKTDFCFLQVTNMLQLLHPWEDRIVTQGMEGRAKFLRERWLELGLGSVWKSSWFFLRCSFCSCA